MNSDLCNFDLAIYLTKDYLANLGDKGLIGHPDLIQYILEHNAFPATMTLYFEQTTIQWRRDNGGPEEFICAEYAPMCLAECIALLAERGVKLKFRDWPKDPPKKEKV
jgi:hypothetical protein